jgi:hypothetical protein
MPLWIRPNLIPADRAAIAASSVNNGPAITGPGGTTFTLTAVNDVPGQPGAWLLSSRTVNAAGQPVSTTPAACTVTSIESSPPAFNDCLARQGIREAITYQPASRYWPFRWAETTIYLTLALAMAGYCLRRLSRYPS